MNRVARNVTIDVVDTAAIAPAVWHEIWRLTHAFYDTDRSYIEANLKRHQRTVLFRTPGERALVGMASVDVCPVVFRGRRIVAIYTSHVLLEEKYRGLNLIQRIG